MIDCYHVTDVTGPLKDRLDNLAYRIERLSPHPRRPERFHEDKSEIVAELQQLAQEVRSRG